jgi:class 3 adenylate cyclase
MALRNQRLYLEREELLRAFERFVPKRFIELLGAGDVRRVEVGALSRCEMTVLFVDVIGFTRRSETISPAGVFALLNRLYGAIGPIVDSVGGLIDKYQGDGVLVLFPGDRAQAVQAAVAIQRAVRALSGEELERVDASSTLEVGVSLHRGPVVLGTVGHSLRFDTTVVSDVVNVAARLQSLCRTLRTTVLAAAPVVDGVAVPLHRPIGAFSLRGRDADVEVHEIFEGDPDDVRACKQTSLLTFAEGVALRRAGRYLEAASAFQQCINRCPEDQVAIWLASQCLEAHRGR